MVLLTVFSACGGNAGSAKHLTTNSEMETIVSDTTILDTATFGGGCFWCTEAIFLMVKGVQSVDPGYEGGKIANPTYKEVCSGFTGHAEVIRVVYRPALVAYKDLLDIFWATHDPTTLNRQGADVGTQYRSVVFYHSEQQKLIAESYKNDLDTSGVFDQPIVTEIRPHTVFYPAEDYHQNYFNRNKSEGYCRYVINPKLEKFKKNFSDKVKKE